MVQHLYRSILTYINVDINMRYTDYAAILMAIVSCTILSFCALHLPAPGNGEYVNKIVNKEEAYVNKIFNKDDGVIDIKDISDGELEPVKNKFDEMVNSGKNNISFRINSHGGSIFSGLDFIQYVEDKKKSNNLSITCYVDSRAFSMGFVILQSFCDKRYMTNRSLLVAHNAMTQSSGNSSQLRSDIQILDILSDNLVTLCANRMGMSKEEFKLKIGDKEWFIGPNDAVKYNAVDGIVDQNDIPPPFKLEDKNDVLRKLFGL